jgi:hypothetical protein
LYLIFRMHVGIRQHLKQPASTLLHVYQIAVAQRAQTHQENTQKKVPYLS